MNRQDDARNDEDTVLPAVFEFYRSFGQLEKKEKKYRRKTDSAQCDYNGRQSDELAEKSRKPEKQDCAMNGEQAFSFFVHLISLLQ